MPDKQPAISSYTSAELLQYATGSMSAAEMHTLEKAALEDPFLAEALEGYMEAVATQPLSFIQAQTERIASVKQKKQAAVVPVWQQKSVRVAIAALFIAGSSWAVFSLLQKPAVPATAVVQQAPVQQPTNTGTNVPAMASEATLSPSLADSASSSGLATNNNENIEPSAFPVPESVVTERKKERVNDFTVSAAPYSLQKAAGIQTDSTAPMQDIAKANAEPAAKDENKDIALAMRRMQSPQHAFKGQIIDTKNNPVPYANVMIEGQNFGTYSDASGHFNFLSEDSLLHIRVRSVGYTNQAFVLQTNRPEAHLTLQDNQQLVNSLPLTVQSRRPSTDRLRKSIIERDSIVGQEVSNLNVPYYDLYLLNNNRISPLPTQNRQVQLNFDISQTGEATNITVVKSSGGKAMDEEAIRLVKEGPKLNTGSTTGKKKKVTVRF